MMSPVLSVIIIVITSKVIISKIIRNIVLQQTHQTVLKLCLSPMWANVGKCGKMWANVGKCGQMWANVG